MGGQPPAGTASPVRCRWTQSIASDDGAAVSRRTQRPHFFGILPDPAQQAGGGGQGGWGEVSRCALRTVGRGSRRLAICASAELPLRLQ